MTEQQPGEMPAGLRETGTVAAVETAVVSLHADRSLFVRGARGVHDRSDFVMVRVQTSLGVTGYGEVSATPRWSGEDAASATHFLRDVLGPALIGEPLASVPALRDRMELALAGNPFTKAGFDTALWDALARTLGVRVVDLLGGPRRTTVPTKMSISGDGDVLAGTLEAIRARGFRSFKVKVGTGHDRDVARFRLARELAGDATFLGADSNGGWTRNEAMRTTRALLPYRPAFIEQPVAPHDLEGMRQVRSIGLPVVADESVYGPEDVAAVIRAEAADVVSVYVGMAGGLGRARPGDRDREPVRARRAHRQQRRVRRRRRGPDPRRVRRQPPEPVPVGHHRPPLLRGGRAGGAGRRSTGWWRGCRMAPGSASSRNATVRASFA